SRGRARSARRRSRGCGPSRSSSSKTSSSGKRGARSEARVDRSRAWVLRRPPMRLQNRVAIITGAAQGIGRVYALRFAREGAQVVVADLRVEAAEAVAAECSRLGPRAIAAKVDVSSEASAVAL